MTSFFDKLKKGMGIEPPQKIEKIEGPELKIKEQRPRKKRAAKIISEEKKPEEKAAFPEDLEKIEKVPIKEKTAKWFDGPSGELQIDIYQTENELVIQSAIAGIRPENLEISMEKDVIAIKGEREKPPESSQKIDYFSQECYWGPFSREIITPVEVDPDRAEASMKNGILIIKIPKTLREKKRKIEIKNQ